MLWRIAQATSVLSAVGVVGLLLFMPSVGLFVTWDLLVPAVPLVLLVAPQVWRNLCPIAVVHSLPAELGWAGARGIERGLSERAPLFAGLALFMIVPLRLTIFNHNGPALAAFVLTVLVIALVGALRYRGKAGWCATFCPVLPVERLYGQRALVSAPHAFCARCTGCVRECYDIDPQRSLQRLSSARGGARRVPVGRPGADAQARLHASWMGLFAAAFPGFVLGYFTAPGSGMLANYAWILGLAAISLLVLTTVQALARVDTASMMRFAAAAAASLYYWYTVPSVAQHAHQLLAIPDAPMLGVRIMQAAMIGVAGFWLLRPDSASTRPIR